MREKEKFNSKKLKKKNVTKELDLDQEDGLKKSKLNIFFSKNNLIYVGIIILVLFIAIILQVKSYLDDQAELEKKRLVEALSNSDIQSEDYKEESVENRLDSVYKKYTVKEGDSKLAAKLLEIGMEKVVDVNYQGAEDDNEPVKLYVRELPDKMYEYIRYSEEKGEVENLYYYISDSYDGVNYKNNTNNNSFYEDFSTSGFRMDMNFTSFEGVEDQRAVGYYKFNDNSIFTIFNNLNVDIEKNLTNAVNTYNKLMEELLGE